jgi:hypothetical protein
LTPLVIDVPNSFQPAGRIEDGIPAIRIPDASSGVIDIPGTYAFGGYAKNFQRGYLQSWNVTLQKQLRYGFVGEAGYVATRQTRQLGYFDINSGQIIGGDQAGRPLFQKFGRTAATTFIAPMGTGQYNGLQTRLERRFSKGLQMGAHYTWSKTIGPIDNSDSSPSVRAYSYLNLNRVVRSYDRTHNLQLTAVWELPFGKGRPFLNGKGALVFLAGGWQINGIVSLYSGLPLPSVLPARPLPCPAAASEPTRSSPPWPSLVARVPANPISIPSLSNR